MSRSASHDAMRRKPSRARRAFRDRILKRDGYRCTVCHGEDNLTLHHKTPIAHGGQAFAKSNVVTLCRWCHDAEHGMAVA